MKGKYQKKKHKNTGFRWILIVLVLIAAGIAALWVAASSKEPAELTPPETTQAPQVQQTMAPTEIHQTTVPAETTEPEEPFQPINLGYGVYLEQVRSYTGIYMEDGSDQLVTDVMMIRIHNTGEDDIQLMNIEVSYPEETFRFTVTNLPAGATAVLLELERASMPEGNPISAVADDVVLFSESMTADFGVYEISGMDGALNVKNISGADISGDIYVYYKYKIQDVYYGGITFRVKIDGGLPAGEIRQIMTSHFNPDNCEVIMIEVVQSDGT